MAMRRAEPRPRLAPATSNPRSVSVRRALVQLPVERPVASTVAATVPEVPQSSASATARTARVQRGGFSTGGWGRPVRDTMTEPTAISAAPVSSTQPTPAPASASRAPADMSRATTTSGRRSRASTRRTFPSRPSPTHSSRSGTPPTTRSASMSLPAFRTLAARGSTARNASSARRTPDRSTAFVARIPKYLRNRDTSLWP